MITRAEVWKLDPPNEGQYKIVQYNQSGSVVRESIVSEDSLLARIFFRIPESVKPVSMNFDLPKMFRNLKARIDVYQR